MNTPTTDKTMLRYARSAGVMSLLIIVVYMSGLTLNTSFQSGTLFIPSALSIIGIFASASVTVVGFSNLINPGLLPGNVWWMPMFIAEIATGLWLIIKGIDLDWWKRRTAAAAAGTGS